MLSYYAKMARKEKGNHSVEWSARPKWHFMEASRLIGFATQLLCR